MAKANAGGPAAPSGDAPKRRNRKGDVMAAAVDVFWRKGYAAASVQDVAEGVGVLKGSLYYYISSKEDLLFGIVVDVHDESRRILDDAVELDARPLERLRTYMERHVEWYLDNVEKVTVYFRDRRYLTGERLQLVTERRGDYDRVVRQLIRSAQEAGEVDSGIDVNYASLFLLAAVNHVPEWYERDAGDSPSHIARAYADLAVGTLLGARSRPSSQAPAERRAKPASSA